MSESPFGSNASSSSVKSVIDALLMLRDWPLRHQT